MVRPLTTRMSDIRRNGQFSPVHVAIVGAEIRKLRRLSIDVPVRSRLRSTRFQVPARGPDYCFNERSSASAARSAGHWCESIANSHGERRAQRRTRLDKLQASCLFAVRLLPMSAGSSVLASRLRSTRFQVPARGPTIVSTGDQVREPRDQLGIGAKASRILMASVVRIGARGWTCCKRRVVSPQAFADERGCCATR